jgi:hypothetical protein
LYFTIISNLIRGKETLFSLIISNCRHYVWFGAKKWSNFWSGIAYYTEIWTTFKQ